MSVVEIPVRIPDEGVIALSASLIRGETSGLKVPVDFLRVNAESILVLLPTGDKASHVDLTLHVDGRQADVRRIPVPFSARRNDAFRVRSRLAEVIRLPAAAHRERMKAGMARDESFDIFEVHLEAVVRMARRAFVEREGYPGAVNTEMEEFIQGELGEVRRLVE
jgi:hypothetical protein